MKSLRFLPLLPKSVAVPLLAVLAACGGGGGDPAVPSHQAEAAPDAGVLQAAISDADRVKAATATATSNSNICYSIRPFYWEIGDVSAAKAGGSVKSSGSTTSYGPNSVMPYTSASKWMYAAYVAEVRAGVLATNDVDMLSLRSGYTNFLACTRRQTVDSCLAYRKNGVYDPATAGKFYYGGGHMQKHASMNGLGSANGPALAAAIKSRIGTDIAITYSQPQPAGGASGTPDAYARFLRKLIGRQLKLGDLLGSHAVCAAPTVCPTEAIYSPMPPDESWSYSIGHWVESDPAVGDGSFSSAGVDGFYPWIDASRSLYGIVARSATNGVHESVHCGQLIRKAWFTGVAQ
ncbi:MAG TPA: hypothetical protein PL196_00160 [Burkholderiaceae bacterium]|nr:hypothetical protein [Burkholderiaceae bacterium]